MLCNLSVDKICHKMLLRSGSRCGFIGDFYFFLYTSLYVPFSTIICMAFIVRYSVTKNKMNEFVNKVKEVFMPMDLLLGYILKCRILMQKWGTLKSKIFIPRLFSMFD